MYYNKTMVSRFIDMTYHSSFDQCNVGNVGHTCTLAVKMFGPGSLFNKLSKNFSATSTLIGSLIEW